MKYTFDELLARCALPCFRAAVLPGKQLGIYENGRCKLHGGLSTGPTTEEGKRRAALNGLKPKRKKRTP